jgi:hypothetical protein
MRTWAATLAKPATRSMQASAMFNFLRAGSWEITDWLKYRLHVWLE